MARPALGVLVGGLVLSSLPLPFASQWSAAAPVASSGVAPLHAGDVLIELGNTSPIDVLAPVSLAQVSTSVQHTLLHASDIANDYLAEAWLAAVGPGADLPNAVVEASDWYKSYGNRRSPEWLDWSSGPATSYGVTTASPEAWADARALLWNGTQEPPAYQWDNAAPGSHFHVTYAVGEQIVSAGQPLFVEVNANQSRVVRVLLPYAVEVGGTLDDTTQGVPAGSLGPTIAFRLVVQSYLDLRPTRHGLEIWDPVASASDPQLGLPAALLLVPEGQVPTQPAFVLPGGKYLPPRE